MSDELPKSVTVGNVVYTVKLREMDGAFGHCDYTKCELVINETANRQRQAKTLVHETIHALLYECGLLEINHDERQVTALENGLWDLLRNNDFGWTKDTTPKPTATPREEYDIK